MQRRIDGLNGVTRVCAVVVACLPGVVAAQDRLPAATGSSDRAAFQVQGLPVGAFRLYPVLRISTDYDDNISRSNNTKRGDGSVIVAPTVAARSNWSSHMLNGTAFYRSTHYYQRTEQDHDEYGVATNGRLDVRRTTKILGNTSYARLAERRGTPGDLFIANRLIQFDTATVAASVSQQLNRIGLVAGVSAARFDYDDVVDNGVVVDQDFRNRDIRSINGRVEYQYSATTSLFASTSLNRVSYDNPLSNFDRSSRGVSTLAGVRYELTRLLSGEIGVGYITQKFRDPRFSDFSGLNYDTTWRYTPTELTTITLSAQRRLTDSALFQVVGVLASDVRVGIDHELTRNILVNADAGYTRYQYRGISRADNRYSFGIGARYKLNRYLSTALSGDHVTQDAGDSLGRHYSSNRVTLSLIASR